MARQWLSVHQFKLGLMAVFALVSTLVFYSSGTVKPLAEIDWQDVLGEGGSALAIAVWAGLILGCRPVGRVTTALFSGLALIHAAFWLDALDEFFSLPAKSVVLSALESYALPAGVALLTVGLWHWHKEQLALNRQLEKREQLFRNHQYIDPLTQLNGAAYLKQQLQTRRDTHPDQSTSVLLIRLNAFTAYTRNHGFGAADKLLASITEFLLLNLRSTDLLCRFSADTFAVVLAKSSLEQAQQQGQQLQNAVANFAFKNTAGATQYQSITFAVGEDSGRPADELIQQLLICLKPQCRQVA